MIKVLKEWNSDGQLLFWYNYEYFFLGEEESCYEVRINIEKNIYYENGQLAKVINVESFYECEECPCGDYTEYSEDGNQLISQENYGDCFDGVLDCLDL